MYQRDCREVWGMNKEDKKTIAAVLQKAETEMLAKKRRAENPTYTDLYGQRMTTRLEEGRAEDGDD